MEDVFVCLIMTPQLHSNSHDKLIKFVQDYIIQKLHILPNSPRMINLNINFLKQHVKRLGGESVIVVVLFHIF